MGVDFYRSDDDTIDINNYGYRILSSLASKHGWVEVSLDGGWSDADALSFAEAIDRALEGMSFEQILVEVKEFMESDVLLKPEAVEYWRNITRFLRKGGCQIFY
ncbi:MAG: hypothetical protein H7144_17880 [Burkholderiales bacterium]|nr:hypothetical protein [Phycisphaerae bacterium]